MANNFIQNLMDARKAIVSRDGGKCKWCESTVNLEVHHILPKSQGGTDAANNLVTLCHKCHKQWHREQSAKEAQERKAKKK